jgi:hypothetical protein
MATKSDSGFGLLSEFGLDLGSEKDVRSAMRQKRISDAMKFVTPDQGGERPGTAAGFGMLGAAVGNAIGERFGQKPAAEEDKYAGMPVEIQSRLKTVDETKHAYEVWQRANPTAKQEEIQDKYQELLAERAFSNDLPDVGIGVLRQLQDRRTLTAKREAELEKLGYENKYDKETIQSRIALAKYQSNKEGVIQFYPRNSQSPNAGLTGHLDAQGNVTTIGDDGQPKTYTPSQYTLDRPQWYPNYGHGGSGGADGVGKVEEAHVRKTLTAAMKLNTMYVSTLDLIQESFANGGGNPMGKVGGLVSMGNRWVGYVEQAAAALQPDGRKPTIQFQDSKYDLNNAGDRAKWAKDNAEWARKNVPGLATKGQFADRYISLITELTYAKAMSMEGGSSRSLSDNDFRNSWRAIGGNINDPKAMASVLMADADRLDSGINDMLYVYTPETVQKIVAERGFERYAEGRTKLDKYRSGEAWAVPSSGATGSTKAAAPARAGWTDAEWNALTDEERASLK